MEELCKGSLPQQPLVRVWSLRRFDKRSLLKILCSLDYDTLVTASTRTTSAISAHIYRVKRSHRRKTTRCTNREIEPINRVLDARQTPAKRRIAANLIAAAERRKRPAVLYSVTDTTSQKRDVVDMGDTKQRQEAAKRARDVDRLEVEDKKSGDTRKLLERVQGPRSSPLCGVATPRHPPRPPAPRCLRYS